MTEHPSDHASTADPPGRSRPPVAHPHDHFFRGTLQGQAEQAALVAALFPALAEDLRGARFEVVEASFVDENLRATQSDVVLRTRLGGQEVYVYALVEHQRSVDPWMAVRMLRYQARIWDRYAVAPGDSRDLRGSRCAASP